MGWTGLCVEPLPSAFAKLRASRKAICENVCVADFEGEAEFTEADDPGRNEKMLSGLTAQFDARHHRFMQHLSVARTTRKVQVTRLSKLLEKHGIFDIDYCSIDTEGAEIPILSELDLDRFRIAVLTVEDNSQDERIPKLMAAKGYDVFARLEQDIVFKRRDVKPLARTSVFCAVWHRDPNRARAVARPRRESRAANRSGGPDLHLRRRRRAAVLARGPHRFGARDRSRSIRRGTSRSRWWRRRSR